MNAAPRPAPQRPVCYQIRFAETLDCAWLVSLLELDIRPAPGATGPGTCLWVRLPDQSALYGLLSRVRDLNLTLLEVKRVAEV